MEKIVLGPYFISHITYTCSTNRRSCSDNSVTYVSPSIGLRGLLGGLLAMGGGGVLGIRWLSGRCGQCHHHPNIFQFVEAMNIDS